MKRILAIVLVTISVISLAACTSKEAIKVEGAYNDGTYKSQGEKWDFGHEEAVVVIQDGKIQDVSLRRIDTEGNEVDYDAYHEMGGPDLAKAKEELSKTILEKQTFQVDSVSGATVSSGNWTIAVERALKESTK